MVSKALYGDSKLHVAGKQSLDNPLVQIMTWYNRKPSKARSLPAAAVPLTGWGAPP
jgi:hypothetical protein